MKQNRHTLMAKGIMVLLTLLILVFIITFAWFVDPHAPAIASGLSMNTNVEVNYDVAVGFESPYTAGRYVVTDFISNGSLDFENLTIPASVTVADNVSITNPFSQVDPVNLLEDFNAVDLTGNGIKLYRPEMTANNRSIDYDKAKVDYDITDNYQYISFDIYVRSTDPHMSVSLSEGSYVLAACELRGENDEDYSLDTIRTMLANDELTVSADEIDSSKLKDVTNRRSSYGTAVSPGFSEDSVIGAVRAAFTQYKNYDNFTTFFSRPAKLSAGQTYASDAYQLNAIKSMLWIPRSDIYLQDTNSQAANDWTLKTNSDTGNAFQSSVTFNDSVLAAVYGNVTYEQAAKMHKYYDDDNIREATYADRYSSVDNPITDLEHQSSTIISVDPNLHATIGQDTYYFGKCRVNLWLEGCDAEARRAIDGGSFFFGLELSSSS